MGISSVGPEEQHPVILGADVNKATLIMCGKDAQYSTGFLQNKIILHAIESFCLFVLFINQECKVIALTKAAQIILALFIL